MQTFAKKTLQVENKKNETSRVEHRMNEHPTKGNSYK